MSVVASVNEQFLSISGRRVRVRVHGDGPPLLLINGLGANLAMWGALIEELKDFQVITFDAPGAGQSQAPLFPYRLSLVADVAARVLEHLGHDQVDLLGYSLGGGVAQEFARRYPQRVRRLVLVSTSCGAGSVPGSMRALMAVLTPARHYAKSGYRIAMTMVSLAPAERASERLRQQAENWHHEAPPTVRGYSLQMSAFARFNSLPWLNRIDHPTLVASSTHDRIIPLANAAILAAHLPNARLLVADQWGHYLLHDPASGVGRAIAGFLSAEDHAESNTWKFARTVGKSELAEYLKAAPRSAHPTQHLNAMVRWLHPVRKDDN